MEQVKILAQNSIETITTAGTSAIAFKLMYGTVYPQFELPVFNYLNSIEGMYIFGLVFGGATALSNVTGDFILPLITGSKIPSSISKFTRPASIGLLSVGLMFALNGFEIPDLSGTAQTFLLGAGANMFGQWIANMAIPQTFNQQLQRLDGDKPRIDLVQPRIDFVQPRIDFVQPSAPIKQSFGGGGDNIFQALFGNGGFSF